MCYETSITEAVFAQGAEAKLHLCKFLGKDALVKERFSKQYRHPVLDQTLSKERFVAELRAMYKCRLNGIDVPAVYFVYSNCFKFIMEYISNSQTVREYIESIVGDENAKEKLSAVGYHIGEIIGRMHLINIIHGDLTTSNFIIRQDLNKIVVIDFGLAEISSTVEKKGVDLFVLEKSLISTHDGTTMKFDSILNGYKSINPKAARDVLLRLDEVRRRGRKRQLFG